MRKWAIFGLYSGHRSCRRGRVGGAMVPPDSPALGTCRSVRLAPGAELERLPCVGLSRICKNLDLTARAGNGAGDLVGDQVYGSCGSVATESNRPMPSLTRAAACTTDAGHFSVAAEPVRRPRSSVNRAVWSIVARGERSGLSSRSVGSLYATEGRQKDVHIAGDTSSGLGSKIANAP